ncbi:MAG: hypothetical protein HY321_16965 [Armatimonadetes bacterium]|nr:hypothetical protein [Armatimonadota bacterium]
MRRILVVLLGCVIGLSQASAQAPLEPTMRDLFRAQAFLVPATEEELGRDLYHRDWAFDRPDRGNFTYFSPEVADLQVTPEKVLRFRMGAGKAVLGWGNYEGKQPLAARLALWPWHDSVELRVRQSSAPSAWRLHFWSDGERLETPVAATLASADWQTLTFSPLLGPYQSLADVAPDGFDLEVDGEPGSTVEIQSLRITRRLHEGYLRKEFDLPRGRVWRAMAEVGIGGYLYVNGREVPLESSVFRRPALSGPAASRLYRTAPGGTVPVEITSYLKPGRNCAGLYCRQVNDSQLVYFQGRVVMASGETVRVDGDETWRISSRAKDGWSRPGFDDSGWQTPETTHWDHPKKVGLVHYYDFLIHSWLIGSGGGWVGPSIPVWDGRLVLENPYERRLFYDAAKPAVVRVRVPEGLAARRPAIRWTLTRSEEEGEHPVARGEATRFRRSGGSLVYEIDCGRRERGVYAIEVALRSGGAVIEERPREPLVVIGRIPMKEVEGRAYDEGMKLTLEDTIDFTDPNDPHPWVEAAGITGPRSKPAPAVTTPNIVRRNGLRYRETVRREPGHADPPMFSYQFRFQRPGDLYVMALEYPDDADRWIGVSCSTTLTDIFTNSKAAPSVWTGDKYPLTNTVQELRWVYRSGPGPHTIDVLALQVGATAAAARLRIYHVDALPALKVRPPGKDARSFGTYTERTTLYTSFGKTFGPTRQLATLTPLGTEPADFPPLPERLRYLRDCLDACEHYAQYLRFTGQNLLVMGGFQYDNGNSPFTPAAHLPTSRVPRDLREMAVRVFGLNGIDVIAGIEYDGHTCLREEYPVNDGQVALGADTALMVSREGRQSTGRGARRAYSPGWSFLHPRVEALMLSVAEEVAEKFKDQPNVKGVSWTHYLTGEWSPGFSSFQWSSPFLYSYDDATIARFGKDTGIRVPGEPKDPARFQQRHEFLTTGAMKEQWTAWRCRKVHDFFLKVRDRVRARRGDLDLIVSPYVDVGHDRAWVADGRPLRAFLREWGHDPILYRDDEGLWLSRWMHPTLHNEPASRKPGYATGWEQSVGQEFTDLYARERNRSAVVMHQFWEPQYRAPGAIYDEESQRFQFTDKSDWPLPGNRGQVLAQPGGENARETFMLALVGADPDLLTYGFMDVNMMVGQEQQIREFGQVLRALPREKLLPALGTGLQTNLAIRELSRDNHGFFYVANPGYWPMEGSVTLSGTADVVDLASGQPVATTIQEGKSVVPVSLKPFGVAAFRADAAVKVAAWSNRPLPEAELSHVRGILADGEQRLAQAAPPLKPEDRDYLQTAIAAAKADMERGAYACAWSRLTHWRYWGLARESVAHR